MNETTLKADNWKKGMFDYVLAEKSGRFYHYLYAIIDVDSTVLYIYIYNELLSTRDFRMVLSSTYNDI
jgi:hypothetical protein